MEVDEEMGQEQMEVDEEEVMEVEEEIEEKKGRGDRTGLGLDG